VVSQTARHSAYAELIAGLLDIRDDAAERRFDEELAAAESAGAIDADTVRTIRWCQRETVRAVVAHAQTVLPPTLIAIENSYRDSAGAQEATATATTPIDFPDRLPDAADFEPDDDAADPPTDLTARRLLVAGLMPLRDP